MAVFVAKNLKTESSKKTQCVHIPRFTNTEPSRPSQSLQVRPAITAIMFYSFVQTRPQDLKSRNVNQKPAAFCKLSGEPAKTGPIVLDMLKDAEGQNELE